MVSKIEKDYLVHEKEMQGKPKQLCYKEVDILNQSQKTFSGLHRQLKCRDSEITKLNKEIDNLKDKLKSKDKQIFDLKFKISSIPKSQPEDTTSFLQPLHRLIAVMEVGQSYSKTQLSKLSMVDLKKIDCACDFLNKYNICEIQVNSAGYLRKR